MNKKLKKKKPDFQNLDPGAEGNTTIFFFNFRPNKDVHNKVL